MDDSLRDSKGKTRDTYSGCLPSLLGVGDKGIEIVYGEEKDVSYWAAEADQKSLVPERQAQRTNQNQMGTL